MKKILIMEDDAYQARLMQRLLEHAGHQIFHAADGQTGLQMALDQKPDLLLLDLGLPDMDGQTVVGLLKSWPDLACIPVIAVTAWPEATARDMATAYGCDGYISKPINAREFPAQIAVYFKSDTDTQD
ncbi:MAG: response regulator [Anaerolineae bacterium]|nr:response regulator [Anaerolineae bacterium]